MVDFIAVYREHFRLDHDGIRTSAVDGIWANADERQRFAKRNGRTDPVLADCLYSDLFGARCRVGLPVRESHQEGTE
ncbi:hypothetical protein D3C73_1543990 [compost metagenome]